MAQLTPNNHAKTVRDALSKNVVVDIGARVGYLVTRFFIPPFALAHVGLETYGLWATAFIIVSYVGISTFGSSAVTAGLKAMRIPLLYALHSGNLYGTERMALATAAELTESFIPTMFAPPGPALVAAESLGLASRPFTNLWEFALQLRPFLAAHRQLTFIATGVVHSLVWCLWNAWYRRRTVHLHIIHGGIDERDSYGRKKLLNHVDVTLVAVSGFVKERLVAHGVRADRIAVIENFLPDASISSSPKRGPFEFPGVRRVLIVSRLDPIKRVDLVFDALERSPHLDKLSVRILGTGWDFARLQARAESHHPNVTVGGFSSNVAAELAAADLLLHPCPAEPFGLAILEAMAAGVPVLVADTGGAASLVDEGMSGFHFHANDAEALAQRLTDLAQASPAQLNGVVAGGYQALATRFSATARLADSPRLLEGGRP